ncbi:MAG: hypothetical protein ACI8QZ_004334 [Chlamydiales bacterium]|jgi:hypothetical protein
MEADDMQDLTALLSERLAPLHGCMPVLVAQATRRALSLHSDAVSVEHLVGAAMQDEDCAAYSVVEHAFADPETIAQELLALSTGIMVVASGSALPFSQLAVEALAAAHAAADTEVDVTAVLRHSCEVLPDDLGADLARMGFDPAGIAPDSTSGPGGAPRAAESSFFALFTGDARSVLSQANRKAARAGEPSIGPAQLILASLEADHELQVRSGLTVTRARQSLAGKTLDLSEIPERAIPPETALLDFLANLPTGSGSLELLAACHGEHGTAELSELLGRHMVTPALLERCVGAFPEPAPGAE